MTLNITDGFYLSLSEEQEEKLDEILSDIFKIDITHEQENNNEEENSST